jgi:hypothetical protein
MDAKWRRNQKTRKELSLVARRGDHLMISFECDLCIFRELRDQSAPDLTNLIDSLLMLSIRRMNLDALWSRATSTVEGNAGVVARGLRHSKLLGLTGPYLATGPLPYYDHCGHEVALQLLTDSRERGSYQLTHKQFDTIRNLRSAYSNQVRSSAQVASHPMALEENQGKQYTRFAEDPTSSMCFARFIEGCKRRMGQDSRPNRGISTDLIKATLDMCLSLSDKALAPTQKRLWVKLGFNLAASYVTSLRGPEGRLLDLEGMWAQKGVHLDSTVLALRGKVKGETASRAHLLPCVHITSSGINLKDWMHMCLLANQEKGRFDGPAVSNAAGFVLTSSEIDDMFHNALIRVLAVLPDLFPPDIQAPEDIKAEIQSFRSLCRSSNARAVNKSIAKIHVDMVNRWA